MVKHRVPIGESNMIRELLDNPEFQRNLARNLYIIAGFVGWWCSFGALTEWLMHGANYSSVLATLIAAACYAFVHFVLRQDDSYHIMGRIGLLVIFPGAAAITTWQSSICHYPTAVPFGVTVGLFALSVVLWRLHHGGWVPAELQEAE